MTLPWRNAGRAAVVQTASVPAPIGGLNARDSVAAMPVTDALILRNWFPFPYAVAMRKGWKERTIGFTAGNEATVAMYNPTSGAPTFVVFSGGKIYAALTAGSAPSPAVTGMNSDYWQTTMFSNTGGTFLYAVNGADNPRVYDGMTFTEVQQDLTPPPSGFDISGVDPKKFIHIAVHQRRLWFAEKDSAQAWFLPVDQIGGIAQPFPLGQLWKFGGYLVAVYTWTVDSGTGMDDKLVFVSSQGEIAIYSGTDPEDATLWNLDGVFRVGSPVGRRCGVNYGGDLLLITTDGVIPLSKAVQSTRVNTADNLTDKIQHTISILVSQYKTLVGWQLLLFQNENQIWLVIPVPTGVEIYTMNTITGAWAQFTNMDVRSVCLFEDNPVFMTSDGRLCQAWVGYFDNTPWNSQVGDAIDLESLPAYNYFNLLGQTKRWTMARPIFQSGTIPPAAFRLEVDFAVIRAIEPPAGFGPSSDYVWDVAIWDQARWNQEYERFRRWISVEGMGYAASLHILVKQNVETLWVATDYVFEPGGVV